MLAALLLPLCLLPQEETPLAGRVLDAAGKPVAGARVTLLHRPIARHLDPAREHRVLVTTDARGAFRAPLHADAAYSVWAASELGASAVHEGLTGGGFVELRTEPGTGPQVVPLTGLEAWDEGPSLRWRVLVGGEHLDFVPVERHEATLHLPPLPPNNARAVEVLTADDRVLWIGNLGEPGEAPELALPPPTTWTLRVADPAGAPLADVEILAHVTNYWATTSPAVPFGDRFRTVWPSQGRTDADGKLVLRLARRAGRQALHLLARKDGFLMSFDGVRDGRVFRAGRELPADEADGAAHHVGIVLQPAPPQTFDLRLPDGSPYAVDTLFVVARVHMKRDGGGGIGMPFQFPVPVVDGRAVLPSPLPAGTTTEVAWTSLAPGVRAQLKARHGFAPPVALRLPQADQLLAATQPVRIDPLAWRELQVVAADGRPAAHTVVQLREKLDSDGRLLRTDRLGRLLYERLGAVRVSVLAKEGIGGLDLAGEGSEPARLALRALRSLAGRTVDGDGKPVASVAVSSHFAGDADEDFLAAEHRLLSTLLPATRSDADGRFELRLPPFPARVDLYAQHRGRTTTLQLPWDPAAPEPVVLTFDGR